MIKPTDQLVNRCAVRMNQWFDLAEKLFRLNVVSLPTIVYDIKGRTLVGQACLNSNKLRVNPVYLQQYTDDYLHNVIGHEVAHFVVHLLYKRGEYGYDQYNNKIVPKSHGKQWKQVMVQMGLSPNRTCNYNLPKSAFVCSTPNRHTYKITAPREGSKLYACYEVFKRFHYNGNRNDLIRSFIDRIGMTSGGAVTYYNKCLKLYQAGVGT